jgi:hypothetical protein
MNKKNILLSLLLVVVLGLAFWIYQKNHASSIAQNDFTQFAIEDTASIQKIFIVDHDGNKALLERNAQTRLWNLNKKYHAREDAINNLLQVINRVRVRGNVANTARDNMMKIMATSGKKVEIYTHDLDHPTKVYYIGPNTADHCGTIMLLELDGDKSPEPYICHMEGFTGFLNPRFFAEEMEWRYTGIFDHPKLDIKEIDFAFNQPAWNYKIRFDGGNDIRLEQNGQNIPHFDTLTVKEMLLRFKKIHLESYRTFLKPAAEDSIKQTMPLLQITVLTTAGNREGVRLFAKKGKDAITDENGQINPWDPEYVWALNDRNEMGLAQRFVFDPISIPLTQLIKK